MTLSIQKRDLLRALARTQGVADRKATMPILANVLLTASDDILRLSATDLYLGVTVATQATLKSGTTLTAAVPARTLFDIARNLPDGTVKLALKDGQLRVEAGRARFKLPCMDAGDFPPLPTLGEANGAAGGVWRTLDANVVAELIALTSYSMSSDDTRPHLAGTLFETDGLVARMVTTDGHRLSKAEATLGTVRSSSPLEVLIPHRGIAELKKLVDEARADAKASKSEGRAGGAIASSGAPTIDIATKAGTAFFRRADAGADVVLSMKLVDDKFPPYAKVIPSNLTKSVTVPRAALMEALKRIGLVANDKSRGVVLEVAPSTGVGGTGALRVSGANPDVGEGVEEIDADYVGEKLALGLNAKYALETLGALGALSSEDVVLEMREALDPVVIRPGTGGAGGVGGAGGAGGDSAIDFIGVVMPMRI